jgi:ferredoxin-thioredoxin reductase catalytic subunit
MQSWYEKYAEAIGAQITDNPVIKDTVTEGLQNNLDELNARYCPCQIQKTKDTICPCKEFRTTGHCHCRLFIMPAGVTPEEAFKASRKKRA